MGETSKEALRDSIIAALNVRLPTQPFGVFFSGGVDSSLLALLCKQHSTVPFTCYTVGFRTGDMEDAGDITWARKAAESIGITHVEKVFDLDEAEAIIEQTVKILPKPAKVGADFVVKVGVGAVIVAAASIAKEKTFFGGIGTEEIFAGYERHAKSDDINEECWRGLEVMHARDFVRDAAIGDALSLTLLTPFLDPKVVVEAMRLPGDMKINARHKKVVLREIAEELGLPKEIAWRKKSGAQYGSKFDMALKKLAKKNGFRYKHEYLESLLNK